MSNEPSIGEVRRGCEVGKPDQRRGYIWLPCEYCNECRWVRVNKKGKPYSKCHAVCANSKRMSGQKGENSIAWRGGISHHGTGYIKIYNPEHHRADVAGYVYEHILIWERINNKSLPNGWIIHHINGIKGDNRPENLAGMPSRKHYLVLEAKNKQIRTLEEKVKILEKSLNDNQLMFIIKE